MSHSRRGQQALGILMALTLLSFLLLSTACTATMGSKEVVLKPQVSSPAIATEGVLKVGVDASAPPYAGMFEGQIVGIDVDVAAALANELGLKLELVNIAGQNIDELLSNRTIDLVMDVEQTGGMVMQGIKVGPYIETGPALFTLVKSDTLPTVELTSIAGAKVAAQKDSLSAWSVDELIGKGTSDPRERLEDAFTALVAGQVTYAAADAVVGSYLALDYKNAACVKMLGTPIGVYLGIASDNVQLAQTLTETLRDIRHNGVLKVILTKWLGTVSSQVVMGNSAVVTLAANNTSISALPAGQVDTGDDLPDPANAGS